MCIEMSLKHRYYITHNNNNIVSMVEVTLNPQTVTHLVQLSPPEIPGPISTDSICE